MRVSNSRFVTPRDLPFDDDGFVNETGIFPVPRTLRGCRSLMIRLGALDILDGATQQESRSTLKLFHNVFSIARNGPIAEREMEKRVTLFHGLVLDNTSQRLTTCLRGDHKKGITEKDLHV